MGETQSQLLSRDASNFGVAAGNQEDEIRPGGTVAGGMGSEFHLSYCQPCLSCRRSCCSILDWPGIAHTTLSPSKGSLALGGLLDSTSGRGPSCVRAHLLSSHPPLSPILKSLGPRLVPTLSPDPTSTPLGQGDASTARDERRAPGSSSNVRSRPVGVGRVSLGARRAAWLILRPADSSRRNSESFLFQGRDYRL